jgi:hypothetical protein
MIILLWSYKYFYKYIIEHFTPHICRNNHFNNYLLLQTKLIHKQCTQKAHHASKLLLFFFLKNHLLWCTFIVSKTLLIVPIRKTYYKYDKHTNDTVTCQRLNIIPITDTLKQIIIKDTFQHQKHFIPDFMEPVCNYFHYCQFKRLNDDEVLFFMNVNLSMINFIISFMKIYF